MNKKDNEEKCGACSCSCGTQQKHNHLVETEKMEHEKGGEEICTGNCACDDVEKKDEAHCGCC